MRPLRFNVYALLTAGMCFMSVGVAHAQTPSTNPVTAFLLFPIGAKAVGMGQAVVAERSNDTDSYGGGSELVWWNAAAIAWQSQQEIAIHHSKTVAATGDAITFVAPSRSRGTLALSFDLVNFGEQQNTDDQGPIGIILPRNFVYALSYARKFGGYLAAGMTYKVLQIRMDCSGQCANVTTFHESADAVDFGIQYAFGRSSPVVLAGSVRNIDYRSAAKDNSRIGELPTRYELGAMYQLGFLNGYIPDTEVRAAASFIDSPYFDASSSRLGADVVWQKRVFLRAGYTFDDFEASGASLGFGVATGKLVFDLARSFGGLSADAGESPTYFSLRYLF